MSSRSEPQRYRLSGEVQAIQWRGDNAAELEAFAGHNFDAFTEPCDDDPEATASVLDGTHNTWKLLYAGDWVTRGAGGAFHAVRQAQFDSVYVEVVDVGTAPAAQLADARHELDVLRGIAVDLEQRLDLALGNLTRALADRDQARAQAAAEAEKAVRELARWEAAACGHKATADGLRVQVDKAWAELDTMRGQLAALAPGWASPAALQAAYNEILALCEQAEAERDRRGEELRRAQDVIEAAKAWRAGFYTATGSPDEALIAAVDALDHQEDPR